MKNNVGSIVKTAAFLAISFHAAFYAQEPLNKQSMMAKLFGMFGQSKPVHWFNSCINTKLRKQQKQLRHLLDIPASKQYQELGKEAQNALGIPEEQHVPIKMIGTNSPLRNNILAIVEPDGIYVNEGLLNGYSYGFRRSVLFHEATHVKYNDTAIELASVWSVFVGSAVGAYALIHLKKMQEKICIPHVFSVASALALLTGIFLRNNKNYFCERRADIEGLYATQCSTCVQEMAVKYDKPMTGGYLWKPEMELIAQELERNNMRCAYHKENFFSALITKIKKYLQLS